MAWRIWQRFSKKNPSKMRSELALEKFCYIDILLTLAHLCDGGHTDKNTQTNTDKDTDTETNTKTRSINVSHLHALAIVVKQTQTQTQTQK